MRSAWVARGNRFRVAAVSSSTRERRCSGRGRSHSILGGAETCAVDSLIHDRGAGRCGRRPEPGAQGGDGECVGGDACASTQTNLNRARVETLCARGSVHAADENASRAACGVLISGCVGCTEAMLRVSRRRCGGRIHGEETWNGMFEQGGRGWQLLRGSQIVLRNR